MTSFLGQYNKFWAALAGVALLIVLRRLGVSVPGLDTAVLDLIVGALTAWSVYQVPNAGKPQEPINEYEQ